MYGYDERKESCDQTDHERIWNQVKTVSKEKVSEVMYTLWIEPLKLRELTDERAVVACRSAFVMTVVQEKFDPVLKDALEEVTGHTREITYTVISVPAEKEDEDLFYQRLFPAPDPETVRETVRRIKNDRFDNFPVTAENKKAYDAAFEAAENSATELNPLFICGGSERERSHLSNALVNYFAENFPESRFLYKPIEQYICEVLTDVRLRRERCIAAHKRADFFLLEGLYLIERSAAAQKELAALISALVSSGRQIVIISDVTPDRLHTENETLPGLLKNSRVISMDGNGKRKDLNV